MPCPVVPGARRETPPYLVLRYDTGHEELLVPTPDIEIRVLADSAV